MTALIRHPTKPGYVGVHQRTVSEYFRRNPEESTDLVSPCQECPDRGRDCPTCYIVGTTKTKTNEHPNIRMVWVTELTGIAALLEGGTP